MSPGAERIALSAPHAELSDFDDYFDAADTLGGHGHVTADAALSNTGVSAAGDLRIDDARYRDFNVGTISAELEHQRPHRARHRRRADRPRHGRADQRRHVRRERSAARCETPHERLPPTPR